MKRFLLLCLLTGVFSSCAVRKGPDQAIRTSDVGRIIATLASDDMEGRGVFTPGIEKAADFISDEFGKAGLGYFGDDTSYRQTFMMKRTRAANMEASINGSEVDPEHLAVSSSRPGINWNDSPEIAVHVIRAGEQLLDRYRQIATEGKDALLMVDTSHEDQFRRIRGSLTRGRVGFAQQADQAPTSSVVMILSNEEVKSFRVSFAQTSEELPLFNVVGVLPGKSKPGEYIVFSGHYDHLGIVKPVGQDSIANGADDDASGVTAVISLAKAYAKQKNNERTLLFVAFTAEESGGFGSQYFSRQLNPDSVIAMVNIEMIGKDSKFGPNSVFITGFERSDLGAIMQGQVEGTGFSFYPDPYPEQNLFYRSDNATLAAQGVPAHSFSTVQIDQDEYYHTVKDELRTLDVKNIISTIKAIALGAEGLVNGKETPTRIPKLEGGRRR